MGPLNFLSANFLLVSILTLSILSGINILNYCNELIITADLDNNEKEKLLSSITIFHLLVLFTIGDIAVIKKIQKDYKELKKREAKLNNITLQFISIALSAIFNFTIIYFTTKNLLDDFNLFQLTILGLITFNIIWLLLTQRYFLELFKTLKLINKKMRKFYLTSINWLVINILFVIFSLIILIFSVQIKSYLDINIRLLWLLLFWFRSILDTILCRHFYAKILLKLINRKGIDFKSFTF